MFQHHFIGLLTIFLFFQACKNTEPALTEHGYRYQFLAQKNGPKPKDGDLLLIHNQVMAGDVELVSSMSRYGTPVPYELQIREAVDTMHPDAQKGIWPIYDGFKMMGVGDSMYVWMPLDSNYQKTLPSHVDPTTKEVRLFLHLVEISSKEAEEKKRQEKLAALTAEYSRLKPIFAQELQDIKSSKLHLKQQTTPSGAEIFVKERGTGPKLVQGERVNLHYIGCFIDSKEFDNSYKNGVPFSLKVGKQATVKGFDEAIAELYHGDKVILLIPARIAYGEAGMPQIGIAPNTDLFFHVEVE